MTRAVENLDDLLKIINEVASCTIFELVKRRKRERENFISIKVVI
jgi:hypothetical protein